jgi:hypothetical protein
MKKQKSVESLEKTPPDSPVLSLVKHLFKELAPRKRWKAERRVKNRLKAKKE